MKFKLWGRTEENWCSELWLGKRKPSSRPLMRWRMFINNMKVKSFHKGDADCFSEITSLGADQQLNQSFSFVLAPHPSTARSAAAVIMKVHLNMWWKMPRWSVQEADRKRHRRRFIDAFDAAVEPPDCDEFTWHVGRSGGAITRLRFSLSLWWLTHLLRPGRGWNSRLWKNVASVSVPSCSGSSLSSLLKFTDTGMFPADHRIIERGSWGRRVMWCVMGCVASSSHLSRFWTAMGRRPHQTFPWNIKMSYSFVTVCVRLHIYLYIKIHLKGEGTHSDHQYNESDNT